MRTFVVERDLDGISMPDLHGVIAASIRQVALMREDGDLIHYLGSTYLPADGLCLCFFQAKDETVLTSLNRAARLPVRRIVPAIALARD